MSNIVASLLYKLSADAAEFKSGLEKARNEAKQFHDSVIGNFNLIKGAAASLAGAFAVREIVEFAQHIAEAGEAMGNMSKAIGVPVEELSGLAYAARIADVDIGGLEKSLVIFNKSIAEAALGSGDGTKAFAAMGISVKDADGKIRPTKDLLGEIAERFESYEDGANKTALATNLFGKAGAQMIPWLNEGRAGMEKMTAEAKALGLTLTEEDVTALGEASDAVDRLKAIVEGGGIRVIKEFAGAFSSGAEKALDFAKSVDWESFSDDLRGAVERARGSVDGFANLLLFARDATRAWTGALSSADKTFWGWIAAAEAAISPADAMVTGLGLLAEVTGKQTVPAVNELTKAQAPAIEEIKKQKTELEKLMETLQLQTDHLGMSKKAIEIDKLARAGATEAQIAQAGALLDLSAAYERHKKALEDDQKAFDAEVKLYAEAEAVAQKHKEEIDKSVAALVLQADTLGMNEKALGLYKLAQEGATGAQIAAAAAAYDSMEAYKKAEALLKDEVAAIEADQKAGDALAISRQKQGDTLRDSVLTPQEIYNKRLVEARQALDGTSEGQETYNRLLVKAQEELDKTSAAHQAMEEFAKQAYRNMESFAGQFFFDAMTGDMKDLGDAFVKMLERMVAEWAAKTALMAATSGLKDLGAALGILSPAGGSAGEGGGIIGSLGRALGIGGGGGAAAGGTTTGGAVLVGDQFAGLGASGATGAGAGGFGALGIGMAAAAPAIALMGILGMGHGQADAWDNAVFRGNQAVIDAMVSSGVTSLLTTTEGGQTTTGFGPMDQSKLSEFYGRGLDALSYNAAYLDYAKSQGITPKASQLMPVTVNIYDPRFNDGSDMDALMDKLVARLEELRIAA